MDILFVTDGYPPTHGGLEGHVARLAGFAHTSGDTVRVVSVTPVGHCTDPWEVVSAPTWLGRVPLLHQSTARTLPPPWNDPSVARVLTEQIRRRRPDVVHAHGWCAATSAAVARSTGVPHITTLHDYGMLCPMRTLQNDGRLCAHTAGPACIRCPGSNQSAPKRVTLALGIAGSRRRRDPAAHYLAVSTAVADIHHRRGVSGSIEVVPNFIPDPTEPASPVPLEGPVLFVGPDDPVKGLPTVLGAHRILGQGGFRLPLHHVGGTAAPTEHGIVRSGRLDGDPLRNAFESARLVLVPSTWQEPCPTVALEAMAAGRAVVGSSVGGLTDIVDDGVTGILVPPGDAGALAEAVRELYGDPDRLAAMGAAGRARVARFTLGSVGPRIRDAYVRVIAS